MDQSADDLAKETDPRGEVAAEDPRLLDRRELIKGAAAAGALSIMGWPAGCGGFSPRRGSLVRDENALPGTLDWQLTRTAVDPATRWRSPAIEGYCSATSVKAGDRLQIMVSVNPASRFTLDLYRLGYYGGKGGRHLGRLGPFEGAPQATPGIGPERLRECRWEPAAEILIPSSWVSGVYLGKLTAELSGMQSYVVFIVRDDRRCDLLFQCSTNTWAAYNRWPDHWSLYDNGIKEWYWGPGVRVSWNRPYAKYCQIVNAPLSQGSGEFLLWEFPQAFWLEQHGYDVSYIANCDTHTDRGGLERCRLWISAGHDEYWSLPMYENVKAALAAGVNLAFLSANTCYGVIDYHPDRAGSPRRAIRRIGQFGPIDPRNVAAFNELLMLPHNGPDESLIIGARSCYPLTGIADWTCVRQESWIFEGTGMRNGDSVPALVGWEWHGKPAPIKDLEVVASSALHGDPTGASYTATVFPGPRGNFVFNAATCWWGDGLSAPPGYRRPRIAKRTRGDGPDPRVQRITANLISRALRA